MVNCFLNVCFNKTFDRVKHCAMLSATNTATKFTPFKNNYIYVDIIIIMNF